MNLLAAKMLNRNLVELDALDVFGDFLFDFFGRRVVLKGELADFVLDKRCLLYTSPSPRDYAASRMPSSA